MRNGERDLGSREVAAMRNAVAFSVGSVCSFFFF